MEPLSNPEKASLPLYRGSRGWTADSTGSGSGPGGRDSVLQEGARGEMEKAAKAWTVCTCRCLSPSSPDSPLHGGGSSPALREGLGRSRCQIRTRKGIRKFKCRA